MSTPQQISSHSSFHECGNASEQDKQESPSTFSNQPHPPTNTSQRHNQQKGASAGFRNQPRRTLYHFLPSQEPSHYSRMDTASSSSQPRPNSPRHFQLKNIKISHHRAPHHTRPQLKGHGKLTSKPQPKINRHDLPSNLSHAAFTGLCSTCHDNIGTPTQQAATEATPTSRTVPPCPITCRSTEKR